MGKKTKKRPRWRRLSLEDAETPRSLSPGPSEADCPPAASHSHKHRPRPRSAYTRSHSVTTYVFDEAEYTKIQTPRQDMIFKKSAFAKRRTPVENSLSEEPDHQRQDSPTTPSSSSSSHSCPLHHDPSTPNGVHGCIPPGVPACLPADIQVNCIPNGPPPAAIPLPSGCPSSMSLPGGPLVSRPPPSIPPPPPPAVLNGGPPSEVNSTGTPESSEVSSDGKSLPSECGDASEPPKDPLAALASQIQYAFIDPQGNVFFNVMDETGIIHLPPVAGYYLAPSFPGGPMLATPVPWQAVPIAPLDSPEYQALMAQQRKQQQPAAPAAPQITELPQQSTVPVAPPEPTCNGRPHSVLADQNSAATASGATPTLPLEAALQASVCPSATAQPAASSALAATSMTASVAASPVSVPPTSAVVPEVVPCHAPSTHQSRAASIPVAVSPTATLSSLSCSASCPVEMAESAGASPRCGDSPLESSSSSLSSEEVYTERSSAALCEPSQHASSATVASSNALLEAISRPSSTRALSSSSPLTMSPTPEQMSSTPRETSPTPPTSSPTPPESSPTPHETSTTVSPTPPDSPPAASPDRATRSEHELGDPEPKALGAAVSSAARQEGGNSKARRKKKKKKQKKKTPSVDSAIGIDDVLEGCRETAPAMCDRGATCSNDYSATGGERLNQSSEPARSERVERSPSEQTSGVQSDISLPDSPQRRPSGDHGLLPALTQTQDTCVLHGAATVLSRHLTMAPPTATPPPSPTATETESKNELGAVSRLEAAILMQLQQKASSIAGKSPESSPEGTLSSSADKDEGTLHSKQSSPTLDHVDGNAGDDAESCDSFVYEDKSGDKTLVCEASPVESTTVSDYWEDGDSADATSGFEDEPPHCPTLFTDLSVPVDLRRTVILEETESERDRESSPGSALSSIKELTPEFAPELNMSLGKKDTVIPSTIEEMPKYESSAEIVQNVSVCLNAAPSSVQHISQSLEGSLTMERKEEAPGKSLNNLEDQICSTVSETISSNQELPLSKSGPYAADSQLPDVSPHSVTCKQSLARPTDLLSSACEGSPPPGDPPPALVPDALPSPTSSISDKSISSAVRGWLQQQAPGAVFVVADDDSEVEIGSDADWESEDDTSEPQQMTGPKNVQGNPSPVACSDAAAVGERVASRISGPCYECRASPAGLRLKDLDAGAVLTLPLHPAAPAINRDGAAESAASSESESLAAPALLKHNRCRCRCTATDATENSLASELLQAGCIHRESDRRLIGDSAFLSPALTPATKPDAARADGSAEAVDEGYGGSPLSSPEARREPRPRRLVQHPLRLVQTETPAPVGLCCSLQ